MGQYDRVRRNIASHPKLSILICTVPARGSSFAAIVSDLEQQIGLLPVQLVYVGDNFSMKVGEKRNRLMELAKGDYISFVDDDDVISPEYVKKIMEGIQSNPSVVVFKGKEYYNGQNTFDFVFSKNNPKNWKDREKKIHHMVPNHLCAWKRELALRERFLDMNLREDHEWGERMLKHIESEYHVQDFLYFYYYDKANSLTH
jgi:glycosyltransferase involved in cell wall biosynthesis